MNTENNDVTLTFEDLKITAKISGRAYCDRQIGTANKIKENKAKVIDISQKLESLNFTDAKYDGLSRELELLNFMGVVDSQSLREFDIIVSAIKYVVDTADTIISVNKNTEFLENLWEKIFGYTCLMTYQDYLQFFDIFLTEYNMFKEGK